MQGLVSGKPVQRPHCIEQQITRDWDCVSLLVSDLVTQGRDLLCPMKTTPSTTVVLSHSTVPSAGSEPRLPVHPAPTCDLGKLFSPALPQFVQL